MSIFATGLACLGLMGCMQSAPITQPPVDLAVTPAGKTRQVFGLSEPTLRTFVKQDDKKVEVTGARCTLESAEFKGTLITPAIVRMPIVKGQITAMNISCTAPEGSGIKRIPARINGTTVVGPSAAGIAAAIITSAIVVSRDRWSHATSSSLIDVQLTPKTD